MHCPLGRCCIVSVGLGVLWLLFTLDVPRGAEDDQARMAVKVQVAAVPSLRGFGVGGVWTALAPLTGEQEAPRDGCGPGGTHWSIEKLIPRPPPPYWLR